MEDEFDNKGTSVLKIYWRVFWRQVESLMIPVGNCIADYMNYEIYLSVHPKSFELQVGEEISNSADFLIRTYTR